MEFQEKADRENRPIQEIGRSKSMDEQSPFFNAVSASLRSLFLSGRGFEEMFSAAEPYLSHPMGLYNVFLERVGGNPEGMRRELPENFLVLIGSADFRPEETPWTLSCGDRTLFVMPVQFEGRLRGFFVTWMRSAVPSSRERAILELIHTYLTFAWMKKAAVEEEACNVKRGLLSDILSCRLDDDFFANAGRFGLRGDSASFVILLSVPEEKDHTIYCKRQGGAALLSMIERTAREKNLNILVIPEPSRICVIVSWTGEKWGNTRYRNRVREFTQELSGAFPQITIGAGRIYKTLHDLRRGYLEAEKSLLIVQKFFLHRKCVNFLDMGVLRLLLTQRREDLDAYLEDILGPVMEYDELKGTELATTLFYYSRFNKSVRYVSKKLNIHANTLQQRIKKAEKLVGYNFEEDPLDWLDIQTASILYGLLRTDLTTKL